MSRRMDVEKRGGPVKWMAGKKGSQEEGITERMDVDIKGSSEEGSKIRPA